MSNKIKKYENPTEQLTETQQHIKELRAKLNAPDPDEIHPFTMYKIITYLCVLLVPLVPYAIYRIWRLKSDFTPREQKIWTAVIAAIAVYMICFAISK